MRLPAVSIAALLHVSQLLSANRANEHSHWLTLRLGRDCSFRQWFAVIAADRFAGSVSILVAFPLHVFSPYPKAPGPWRMSYCPAVFPSDGYLLDSGYHNL